MTARLARALARLDIALETYENAHRELTAALRDLEAALDGER